MYRFFLVLVIGGLLGGCGWFLTDPPTPAVESDALQQAIATPKSLPSALLATPTPRSPATPTLHPIPYQLPTVTPTLWPIGVSLLPLPTATLLSRPLVLQQPITGALIPLPGSGITTTFPSTGTRTNPLRVELVPTPDGVVRTLQAPILMYHYLSNPPTDADIYRRDLSVSPARFAAHLDYLQSAGYTTISLYELLMALNQGAPLPPRPVILTFDDGYRDNYTNAFPLLKARGMTATFFIVTDFIDEQRPEYLTWAMVREMHQAGMAIESHGRNHVRLRGKDKDYLIWQALGSAETIQAELGIRPHFICYPSGEYDQQTINIFQSAHYWAGVTTVQGATHSSEDLFELRRVRVRGTTTVEELARLLEVDW